LLEEAGCCRYILPMDDDTPRPVDAGDPPETEEEKQDRLAWEAELAAETEEQKQRRLAWEAEMIAEAEAELAAGFYVDGNEVLAWLKSVGTDHELPPPPVRQR
jgi:predicted transcriptional regulator